MQQARGVYKGEIGDNAAASVLGAAPMRVKDVDRWAGDQAAAAFVDPNAIPVDAAPNLVRAAAMGRAASTGDGLAMLEANKRYDISDEYRDEFLKLAKIGGGGFGSSIRRSGLDDGRAEVVIDPATGQRVVDLPGNGEKEFYANRVNELATAWLQGGGRGLNDVYDDINFTAPS